MIDTNIILDVLMNRNIYVKDSSLIWKLCETGKVQGYITALSFANMMYIMRKDLSPEKIDNVYSGLSLIFGIADFDNTTLKKAVSMHWNDFEDAVHAASAEQIHANYIITRNIRDYTQSAIPAISPSDFLGVYVTP